MLVASGGSGARHTRPAALTASLVVWRCNFARQCPSLSRFVQRMVLSLSALISYSSALQSVTHAGLRVGMGINGRHLSLSIRVGMLDMSHVWSNQFRGLRDCGCGNIDFFNLHRGPSVVGSSPDIFDTNSGESSRLR